MSDAADDFGAQGFHNPEPQRRASSGKPKRDRRQDPNVPDDHETRYNAAMMALGVNQPSARVTITRLRPSEDKLPSVRGAQVPTFDDFVRYMRDTHWSGDNEEYEWVVYNGRSQYQKRGRLTIAEDPVKQAQFRADRKRRIDEIRSMSDPSAAQQQGPIPPMQPPMGFQQPPYGQPPMAPPVPPHAYQQAPYYQPQYAPPPQPPPMQPPPVAPPPPMAAQPPPARRREEEEEEEYEDREYRQQQRRDYRDREAPYRPRQEYEPEPQRYYQPAPVPVPVPVPVAPPSDPRMDAMSNELRQVMDVVRALSAELGGAKAVSREINPQIAEIHRVAADLQRQMEQYQQQRQMEAAQPPPQQQVHQPPQPSAQQVAYDQEQQVRRNRPRRVPEGYMLAHLSGDPEDPPVLVPIPPGMPGHRPDMVPGYQAPPSGVMGAPPGHPGAYQPPYAQQQAVQAPPPPPPPAREEGGDLEKGITGILGMIERTEHAKQTLSRSLGLVEKSSIVEKEEATPAQPASNIPPFEDLGFWKFNKRDDGKLDMNPLNSFMLNLDKVKDLVGSVTEGAAKLQREQAKAENDELERRVALEERLARLRQGSVSASPVQPTAPQQTQARHNPLPVAHGVNEFRQNPMTSVPSGGDDDSDDGDAPPFGI